jgi:hypothetical protein
LLICAWIDDPEAVVDASLAWAKRCVEAGQPALTSKANPIYGTLRARHAPRAHTRRNWAMWELLHDVPDAPSWFRKGRIYDLFAYLDAGMPGEVADLAQQHYADKGLPAAGNDMIIAAAALGEPAPTEVVQALKEGGIEAVDEYGLFGWYLKARIALAEGRVEEALDALRVALDYWSNPPLGIFAELWEKDRAWDPLRDDPRYQQIWADKRARIGPVHGQLYYFPGW